LWFIVGAIFSSTPLAELFIGPKHTEQDEELVNFYKDIAEKNNKRDKWLVPGEKENGSWCEEINTDLIIEKQFTEYNSKILTNKDINAIGTKQTINPGIQHYYSVEKLAQKQEIPWPLQDYYGRDAEYLETFGQVHSGSVWHMLTFNEEHTTNEFKEFNGADFRPFLYYKSSYIKVTFIPNDPEKDSSTTITPLYLIVEGNGLRDHQTYHYEWKTETTESGAGTTITTWEELVGQTSIRIPWQRLDDWVQDKYEIIKEKKDEIEIARLSVWESGIGYTKATERMEWLFSGQVDNRYLSQSFVPDDIMSAFYAAENLFGIPAWFLASLAMKESSLNPDAINNKSGAIGLFQLTEGTRKAAIDKLIAEYSDKLPPQLIALYNSTLVKDDNFYMQVLKDPYINTLAGSLVLIGKCTNNNIKISDIDWDGNWQKQILPALTDYGGYIEVPKKFWNKYGIESSEEARLDDNVQKWCRDEYASVIFKNAEKFKIEKAMPIDGVILTSKENGGHISSSFGARIHPVTKERSFHYGVDLALPSGTPIRSIAPGKVIFAGYKNDVAGYEVRIDHGTYQTRYLHCLTINARAGDFVNAGTNIAKVGNTGRSTGAHLHFEVLLLNSTGNYQNIDPVPFLLKKWGG